MSEMVQTATRVVVIGRGRLTADTTVNDFVARASNHSVRVRTPQPDQLREMLVGPDITVTSGPPDQLRDEGVGGAAPAADALWEVGGIAAVVFLSMLIASFAAFFVGHALLHGRLVQLGPAAPPLRVQYLPSNLGGELLAGTSGLATHWRRGRDSPSCAATRWY
jgi:hypothetical protein